jgi:hypothetical protein
MRSRSIANAQFIRNDQKGYTTQAFKILNILLGVFLKPILENL